MPVVIGVLLALLVVGVVLYPFVKQRFGVAGPSGNGSGDAAGPTTWRLRREEIYESIRSLQLEYELGGVEETDYRERLRAHRVQAAAVVREQELAEREAERLVELEVHALRDAAEPEPVTSMERGAVGHTKSESARESPAAGKVEGNDGAGR